MWISGHSAQHWPKLTHTCGLDAQTGAQVGDSDTGLLDNRVSEPLGRQQQGTRADA